MLDKNYRERVLQILKDNDYLSAEQICRLVEKPFEKPWTPERVINVITKLQKCKFDIQKEREQGSRTVLYAYDAPDPLFCPETYEFKRSTRIIEAGKPDVSEVFLTDEEEEIQTLSEKEREAEENTLFMGLLPVEEPEHRPVKTYSPSESIKEYVDKCMHLIKARAPRITTIEHVMEFYPITEEESAVLLNTVSRRYPSEIRIRIEAETV